MPHTSSAKKSLRQNEKRRQRNRVVKKDLKLQIKKVLATAKSGPAEALRTEVNTANKKLDRAAAKRVIHRNLAARKKSQLARLLKTPAAPAKTS
jgi:small subunit ribosomal protein S20